MNEGVGKFAVIDAGTGTLAAFARDNAEAEEKAADLAQKTPGRLFVVYMATDGFETEVTVTPQKRVDGKDILWPSAKAVRSADEAKRFPA